MESAVSLQRRCEPRRRPSAALGGYPRAQREGFAVSRMCLRRWLGIAALLLCPALHAQPADARPASAYSAAVATEWFQLALQLTQQTPGFSPPVASYF